VKGEEHSSQPSLIPILVLYTVACLFCSYPPKASRLSESPKLPPSSASPHLPYLRCLRLLFPPLPSSSLPSPLSPLSPLPSPLSDLFLPIRVHSRPFSIVFFTVIPKRDHFARGLQQLQQYNEQQCRKTDGQYSNSG